MTEAVHGVGWAFPVRVARDEPQRAALPAPTEPAVAVEDARQLELAREERSIRESILLIVSTARGERVMRPTFGCGLHELVFETNDTMTAARASAAIRESLIEWEPRVEVLDVRGTPDPAEGRIVLELECRVRRTNNVFNLVYPLYLETAGGGAR